MAVYNANVTQALRSLTEEVRDVEMMALSPGDRQQLREKRERRVGAKASTTSSSTQGSAIPAKKRRRTSSQQSQLQEPPNQEQLLDHGLGGEPAKALVMDEDEDEDEIED
jgi:hypothetical protein